MPIKLFSLNASRSDWLDESDLLPAEVIINPVPPDPPLNTGFTNPTIDALQPPFGGYRVSSGTQNDFIEWELPLMAGTYNISLLHKQDNNRGIYTFSFDGTAVGTVDGYNATPVNNKADTVSSVTVARTGKVKFRVSMLTKNASSSSYFGTVNCIKLRRTA